MEPNERSQNTIMPKIIEASDLAINLEPRVAKLEVGIETLTREISELGKIVREESGSKALQIAAPSTAVERAAAPRSTNWGNLIAAAALVIAVGAAVISPLKEQIGQSGVEDVKLSNRIDKLHD